MSEPRRTRSNVSTGVFAVLCVMGFIMYIDRTNISVVAPLLKTEMQLSNTDLGYVFSVFAVAYACCGVPGAWLIDRIGSRRGMTAFGVLWSLATIATGQVGTLFGLVGARFAVGVGEAPIYASAARVIATWIPARRRGAAQGAMHASGRFANAAAPLVISALITVFAWRDAFVALGVITLAFFAVFYWFIRDNPWNDPRVSQAELATLGFADPASLQAAALPKAPVHWPSLLRRVWPATCACFCHGWVLWFFNNWIPSYFVIRFHMQNWTIGPVFLPRAAGRHAGHAGGRPAGGLALQTHGQALAFAAGYHRVRLPGLRAGAAAAAVHHGSDDHRRLARHRVLFIGVVGLAALAGRGGDRTEACRAVQCLGIRRDGDCRGDLPHRRWQAARPVG